MSSGAFALYIDQTAEAGADAPIHRIVPPPPLFNQDGIHFNDRRLTLFYDNLPANANPPIPATVHVTGHFLGVSADTFPLDKMLKAGNRHVVSVPSAACAVVLEVLPTTPPHGPITALVEYKS
jgi:hypothetical protein